MTTESSRLAASILGAFREFTREFSAITRRSKKRFEHTDWLAQEADAIARPYLHTKFVDRTTDELRGRLEIAAGDASSWCQVSAAYSEQICHWTNQELAQTFLRSVRRRVVDPTDIDLCMRSSSPEPDDHVEPSDSQTYSSYRVETNIGQVIEQILRSRSFDVPYRDISGDSSLVADRIELELRQSLGSTKVDAFEIVRPVFFRNKGAYIIGRIRVAGVTLPLVLALLNSQGGIFVDAVLMKEAEVSVLFSFMRSHFHVEAEAPLELIVFLRTIMPRKPAHKLYISLGFTEHGKAELLRDLQCHLAQTQEQFDIAPGDQGMVMLVFTLPSYDAVLKIIRERFAYPKTITPREVASRYSLVFERDRVGRLIESQEFEYVRFGRDRFTNNVLRALAEEASATTRIDGNDLVIGHVYVERKTRPLNLHLREVDEEAGHKAVIDYGNAIRELAAANIFPGDFLLKNFGVTRYGRVVFYDYDELCLLTDCNFRSLPPQRILEVDETTEPWLFGGAENDIFPEEFRRFSGLSPKLREVLERHHGELFSVEFWRAMRERHLAGEIMDYFPYPQSQRLIRTK